MSNTINIDFDKLETDISDLKNLLGELDEPNYNNVYFWLGDTAGDGMTREYLIKFCNNAIEFHNCAYKLIKNTIAYLETVKKLKSADQSIADSL